MQLVTLGTGSPLPDPNRAGPATLVRAGGRELLFDCGRGVLMRAAAAGVLPTGLAAVLLTHLHSDHVTDFNDVVTMRWAMAMAPLPLPVYGPAGTCRFVERTLLMLEDDIAYRIAHHGDLNWQPECRVTEVDSGLVLDEGGVRITAAPTDHRPVHPTVGYRIEADGYAIVIAGDTVPCEGLDLLCAGADVYVQTVLHRPLIESIPVPRLQDILGYHSSIEDAARTAARAGVRTLVLTHPIPSPAPGTEQDWIDAARAEFSGDVVLAHDGWTLTL
ncbi:MAG: MBL fold metallo-hydrolase [Acidimicrobiales bacterium]